MNNKSSVQNDSSLHKSVVLDQHFIIVRIEISPSPLHPRIMVIYGGFILLRVVRA